MIQPFRRVKTKGKKQTPNTETQSVHKQFSRRRYGRRRGDQNDGAGQAWIVSFTDTMALLLTFFVMLYAMSSPEEKEWKNMTESLQASFNRFYGAAYNRGLEDATAIERVRMSRGLDLDYLQTLFETLIRQDHTLKDVRIMKVERGLVFSLPENLLFETGKAEVTPEGLRALYTLGAALDRIKNRIEIVGHTDPRPVHGGEYGSNWELSFARAAHVAAALQTIGYEKPLGIRGFGSARYDDISGGIPEQERLDLSRRVDIMVMEDDARRVKMLDILGR